MPRIPLHQRFRPVTRTKPRLCRVAPRHATTFNRLTFRRSTPPAEFWLKTDTYLEQPEVTYTKELLLLAEGFKGGESFSASFSTLGVINLLNHAGLRAAVVKVIAAKEHGLSVPFTTKIVGIHLAVRGSKQ